MTEVLGFDDVDASAGHLDYTVSGGIDGMIAAHADIEAGEELCAALAENDIAIDDSLSAGSLKTQIFRVAVATVSC